MEGEKMSDFFEKIKPKMITAIFLLLLVILTCSINIAYSKYCRVKNLGRVSLTLNSQQTITFDANGGSYEYGIVPPSELLVDIGDYIGTTDIPWPRLPINSSGVQATGWRCNGTTYTTQNYKVTESVTFTAYW